MWDVGSMRKGKCELYGGVLVDSGGNIDLGVRDKWNGKWVSKDSVEPGGVVPIPLVSGKV